MTLEKRWVPGFSFVKKDTPTPTLEPPLKQGVRFLFLSRCLGFQAYIVLVYVNYWNDYMFSVFQLLLCVFLPCNLSLRWHLYKYISYDVFNAGSGKLLSSYTHGNFILSEIFVLLAVNMLTLLKAIFFLNYPRLVLKALKSAISLAVVLAFSSRLI